MKTGLYECSVMHKRLTPEQPAFTYQVFMLSVDLDHLPNSLLLGHDSPRLFGINAKDHVDLGKASIKENLVHWLSQQGHSVPSGAKIQLITFPSVLGYTFNPVSFYYICAQDGTPLLSVAEVTNTYREMKLYCVDQPSDKGWEKHVAKDFYVSPFSDPGDAFHFRLGHPTDILRVYISNISDSAVSLSTAVKGTYHPLTQTRLFLCAVKYPLLSLKIIGLIHWQALKLWLRKVPYFKKTDRKDAQRDVLRPHPSITKQ